MPNILILHVFSGTKGATDVDLGYISISSFTKAHVYVCNSLKGLDAIGWWFSQIERWHTKNLCVCVIVHSDIVQCGSMTTKMVNGLYWHSHSNIGDK